MSRKTKNILKVMFVIGVIIYSLFNSNSFNELSRTVGNISNIVNDIDKEITKEETNIKYDNNLIVEFIDVGQADAILISVDSNNMLIDAGNNEDGEKLVKYLKEKNINKFNYVIGTHPHEDHIGGLDNIINNFEITTLYMPDSLTTSKTFEDVLDAMENKNLAFNTPKVDYECKLGNANIKVISNGDGAEDLNDASIVVKLTYGNNSFLFTGDATSNIEKQILNKDIKVDVLKVGHHGSSYSSTNEFLDKVNPKYAVISVGEGNVYNHPTKSILDKLSKRNIKTYRTDLSGTVIFTSDGNSINIKSMNTDTNG